MRLKPRSRLSAFYYARPEKYQRVREAMLESLDTVGSGITLEEITQEIAHKVRYQLFPTIASVRWYTLVVRIDLEARGEVRRLQGTRPLRFLRAVGNLPDLDELAAPIPTSRAV